MKARIFKSLLTPILGISAVGTIAIFSTSCNEQKINVESISLADTIKDLPLGQSVQLVPTISPEEATNKDVNWTSSNPDAVIVDKNGMVTAVDSGKATITVTTVDGGYQATCMIFVKNENPVNGVSLNKDQLNLFIGETEQLTATIDPEDATDKRLSWESSNSSVATVLDDGTVKGKDSGTATITVTTVDGEYQATCKVVVQKLVPVSNVKLNKSHLILTKGKTEQLEATVEPEDATNKNVSWTSSNSDVATVDENGKVTAVSEGHTFIVVTSTDDDNKTATCDVIVESVVPVTSVELNKNELELAKGDSEQLTATVGPENATNKNVIWSSENPSIATVDENGKVTAVNVGETIIYAHSEDNYFISNSCTVAVVIPVTNVHFTKDQWELSVDATEQLEITIDPYYATNQKVTWKSDNPDIAEVDENGFVTGIDEGEATITVTTVDGGYQATCKVVVSSSYVKSVALGRVVDGETIVLPDDSMYSSDDIATNTSLQLLPVVEPTNAEYNVTTWFSSNPNIATVDQNGVVNFLNKGFVRIELQIEDKITSKTFTAGITFAITK